MKVKISNKGFFYRDKKDNLHFESLYLVCPSVGKCVRFVKLEDAQSYGKLVVFLFDKEKKQEFYNLMQFYIVEENDQIKKFIIELDRLLVLYKNELAILPDLEIFKQEKEEEEEEEEEEKPKV